MGLLMVVVVVAALLWAISWFDKDIGWLPDRVPFGNWGLLIIGAFALLIGWPALFLTTAFVLAGLYLYGSSTGKLPEWRRRAMDQFGPFAFISKARAREQGEVDSDDTPPYGGFGSGLPR